MENLQDTAKEFFKEKSLAVNTFNKHTLRLVESDSMVESMLISMGMALDSKIRNTEQTSKHLNLRFTFRTQKRRTIYIQS